ncbi:hypothetical protein KY343_02290 [Candidatus Woesearchaeota archaeon]|nr:hypothetical protein [Candidatus Woesearchaeota archaeon]
MTIDIFVHPGRAARNVREIEEIKDKGFRNKTLEIAETSELAIVVTKSPLDLVSYKDQDTDYRLAIFRPKLSLERSLCVGSDPETLLGRSDVQYSSWDRFVELLNRSPGDGVRLHGPLSVKDIAGQILLYDLEGKYWEDASMDLFTEKREDGPSWVNSEAFDAARKEVFRTNQAKIAEYEKAGAFAESRMRYGHVVHVPFPIKIIAPGEDPNLPHGNVHFQLIDDKTVVYREG